MIRAIVALWVVSLAASFAAASDWKPYGLQGMTVRSLAAAPGILCAGTAGAGVWCRDPAGTTTAWTPRGLSGVTVTWLWIDPLSPPTIFAATGFPANGAPLHRTQNGGAVWEPLIVESRLPPATASSIFMVDGVAGTSIVFAAGDRIWRSDDLGASWSLEFSQPGQFSLDVAETDANTVWAGGETVIFQGYTIVSRDGGATWTTVWNSSMIGDNQTSDIATHPATDGLVLTGHEGFVLRTVSHGVAFQQVLTAAARFFLDWDRINPRRAYAAGSPNGGGGHAFVSRDLGVSWSDITGALAPLTIYRIEADGTRLGVVYAATSDGVYRFYGGGERLCLDTSAGLEMVELRPGPCPPVAPPGPSSAGDVIAGDLGALMPVATRIDLGEVECMIDSLDISLATIDPPEPPPGSALFLLARPSGPADYGFSSDGRPRLPARGDCPR